MNSKKGLCMVEMVLVVAIVCILASVVLFNFVSILNSLEVV